MKGVNLSQQGLRLQRRCSSTMVQVTRPELLKKAQGLSNMFKFNKNAKIASIDIILICNSDVFAVNFEPIQFINVFLWLN